MIKWELFDKIWVETPYGPEIRYVPKPIHSTTEEMFGGDVLNCISIGRGLKRLSYLSALRDGKVGQVLYHN